MKQRKRETRKYLKSRVAILFICVMMVVGQFPMNNYIFAQSNGYMQVSISEQMDIQTQKITIANVKEGITKVALYSDGKLIETKAVSDSLSFDVHRNGDYLLAGLNDEGVKQGEETVQVDTFEDLMLQEDESSHTVTVVSRYPSTFDITVNGKDRLGAAETSTGVYQGTFTVPKNGTYTFAVVDAQGEVLDSSTWTFTDIPNVANTGETIISSADDLKHILADPSGSFLLDQDIELKDDTLSSINFTGTLNGNGHIITGIEKTLFNTVTNANITNIVIKGRLSETAIRSEITNTGFYVEASDAEKDIAVIMNGTDVNIRNSFAFMNVESKNAAGFILKGSGNIKDSYVSGYLCAEEEVYGFGKDVHVNNSYSTASLIGKKRVLFSNGENRECFYDAQINDLEDSKAMPYLSEDMVSGSLNNKAFKETKGNYPEILSIHDFSKAAQEVSALSVVSVTTKSNLSALEDRVDYQETKDIKWKKNSHEIKAVSKDIINRFALNEPKTISKPIAGASTTETTTQIIYPVTMRMYYKVVKSSAAAPELPADHAAAITAGWKLMYWTGTTAASGLDWNTDYTIYRSDLTAVTKGETIKTSYGKNGGKLKLTGNYDVGQTMTAELSGTNTSEGQWIWESASRLDASSWNQIAGAVSNTYKVTDKEKGNYLRVRFITDKTKGYEGELKAVTSHMVQEAITAVKIENKTSTNSTMTIKDQLIASIEPTGKDHEVTFAWYRDGESDVIATGRNYTLKKEDIGKKLYVKATAKDGGELKGDKQSAVTESVQSIKCQTPDINKLNEKAHDDITVTLSMDTDEGLYQFGYAASKGGNITPYTTLSRAQTDLTMTGLSANTTYYLYVKQVGENGYTDSDWSTEAYTLKTDAEHVRGDVIISGDAVYNKMLKAEINNKPADHKGDFIWYRLDENEERITSTRTTGSTYTLTKDDIGHKIEAVYEGKDGYAGEVSNISEVVVKEEKVSPINNLSVLTGTTDTTIKIQMPTNTENENYILGISKTKEGVPIEFQENQKVKIFSSGQEYTITDLERDTTYYFFIRYAENTTHQKSDWIEANKAVNEKTTQKEFTGEITFAYETANNTLNKGQTLTAKLTTSDTSFHYKGTWTWTKVVNGKSTPINTFIIASDKQSSSFLVPETEETGTTYEVRFEAEGGYKGSKYAVSNMVQEPVLSPYEKPDPNNIVMEAIDDSSIKVMMDQGEGQYQFYYKKDDTSAIDSLSGFFTKLTSGEDGYTKVNQSVGADVDLIIEGLERNTRYIVKVQRVKDDKGTASDFAYSSDATTAYTSITTKKSDIAGYVTITGKESFNETLTATYHKASYASIGSGSDENGTWKWYQGNNEITGQTSAAYTLGKEDIGKTIRAVYTMPSNADFQGNAEASTKTIEKAECIAPTIEKIESKDVNGVLSMVVTGKKESEDQIYYILQEASEASPQYPQTSEELKKWALVDNTTVTIAQDTNKKALKANTSYTIYYIKLATDTQNGSAVLSKTYKMGTKNQTGTIALTNDTIIGKSVTATLNDNNNTNGTWHWYVSSDRYGYDNITSMPSVDAASEWTEITSGFSPIVNKKTSTLALSEDMFARYIRAEFVADDEQGFSGKINSTEERFVKKIYEETLTLTSSQSDGNGNPKAYTNSIIKGTINNYAETGKIDRATLQFRVGTTIINGSSITIDKGTFTYKMPNNASYDGKEIVAEVSRPKYIALFVDKDLNPLTTGAMDSKSSTKTSFTYTQGIPISNANDLESFMKATGNYSNRSGNYIITSNINMSSKGIIVYSEQAFSGTLNGDYHTIVGIRNPFFAIVSNGTIKNIVFYAAQVSTRHLKPLQGSSSAAIITRQSYSGTYQRLLLADSIIDANHDSGYLIGQIATGSYNVLIEECFSAGGTIIPESPKTTAVGGLIGWVADVNSVTVKNCYSINTTIGGENEIAPSRAGFLGGLSRANMVSITNSYSASKLNFSDSYAGGLSPVNAGNSNIYANITNGYYDATLAPKPTLSDGNKKGTPLPTNKMIGNELKASFGTDLWTYSEGCYPRLKWASNQPLSKLYSTTRGAFTSIDGVTSYDDMFNGNISDAIQIPVELQTADYSVTSSNPAVLKVVDKMIIPVGNVGEKATITITYTEPDTSIGGTASNTYEFSVKKQCKAMDAVGVVDNTGAVLSSAPKMNQVVKSSETGDSYQWYRRKSGTTTTENIAGATQQTYKITSNDVGYELCVLVKKSGYASTFSSYTNAVVSIQPDAPTVSNISDQSVTLQVSNGNSEFTYEYGYVRNDQNAMITLIDGAYSSTDALTVPNLQRNKTYQFYTRIAKAKDGSYPASDWSKAASIKTLKTKIEGKAQLGTALNNGDVLNLKMEAINSQTGTWKLERLDSTTDTVQAVINTAFSNENSASYTLTADDVGFRIRATYYGRDDFEGESSITSGVILKKMPSSVPASPSEVIANKTDGSLTVKMDTAGTYDIGYAASANEIITLHKTNVKENEACTIAGLKRNTTYYVYARTSADNGNQASNWSQAGIFITAKTAVSGNLTITGDLKVDTEMKVKAPTKDALTGTWKLERVQNGNTTTIAPKDYQVDETTNTLTYTLKPKDALAKMKITFSGSKDYTSSIDKTSSSISNAKQDHTSDMPSDVLVSNVQDYGANIAAKDGKAIYQFGYAKKNVSSITWTDATAEAKKEIKINGLERNCVYDVYVRKASKTGYDPSDAVKMTTTIKTAKSVLNGTIKLTMTDGDLKAGEAVIGKTYQVAYEKGHYEQSGEDMTGTWEWYADNKKVADGSSYTIGPMNGSPEISVRYIADASSDFASYINRNVGTLTKPVFDPPAVLPSVSAEAEDGKIGSKLKITTNDAQDVYYYVQEADNTNVPETKAVSDVSNNKPTLDQWFKAEATCMVETKANTEYIVYAAKLDDGKHQSSGVISQRAVKSVKEDIAKIDAVTIEENDNIAWKVLQEKELRISIGGNAMDGVWQYYVSTDKTNWQNITSEIKNRVQEGKKQAFSYAKIDMPVKYHGYYLQVVFTGRGNTQGNKVYQSKDKLIGTQIKGSVQITSGDTSQVFTPVVASYVFANAADGTAIEDEKNGVWTWYRETGIGTNTYVKIVNDEEHIGITDRYTPTAEDVGKKIYAEYTGALTGIYSGSVRSNYLNNVAKSEQANPTGLTKKQVNGTTVQLNLPSNYKTEGKSIPDVIVEYRIKGSGGDWIINDSKTTWIGTGDKKLKANTAYEVRAKFAGTSEYKPSAYTDLLDVTTSNQSFDEDHLVIYEPEKIETGSEIKAVFTGDGYDEGTFIISRSDGTILNDSPVISKTGNKIETTYNVTSDDIGNNIIIQYRAKSDAATYGGTIEKNTKEVLKPMYPSKPGSPTLHTTRLSETTLKVTVNDDCEYVLNESATAVSEASGSWSTLKKDDKETHTFTGLSKDKTYYLHARYHETANYRYSTEDVSAGTKPWTSTQYTITYAGTDGATNTNLTQYTELSAEITLSDARKDGYTFTGWTAKDGDTPAKGLKIPSGSDGDKAFTAHWSINTYTIAYTLNGGTLKDGGSNPTAYTVEKEDFTLKNPEKKGYTFLGWTWEGEATPKTEVTIPKGSFGEKAYTANWKLNTYTIAYELAGGVNAPSNPKDYTIESETITIEEPTRNGYDFLGWTWDGQSTAVKSPSIKKGSIGNITYTANWKAVEYTIAYDLDNGTLDTGKTNPEKYTIESETITLNNPTRKGYTFKGWSTGDDANPTSIVTITKGSTGAKTYKAIWEETIYTIDYDMDGGTNHADNPSSYKITDADITLKAPIRTGHIFKGWKKNGSGTAEETITIASGSTGNLAYTATWEKVEYTIIFDSNGGSSIAQAGVKYEETIAKPADPAKTGYTFAGWYKDEDLKNEWNFDSDTVTANMKLYAKWTINEYQAVFDVNGGDSVEPATITKKYQEELGTLPTATRTGYTFKGWFTAAIDGEQITTKTKMPIDGATYYAQWTINQYTASFDGNGGSNGTDITVDYGSELGTLPTSTREGYTFTGWYTAKTGGTKISETTKMLANDTTYYAQWTINQYTAAFDGNGGSNETSITADYNSELGTLPISTREGYTFTGWYTAKTGGTKIAETTKMPVNGTTYYAQWKTTDYTITYDLNDGNSKEAKNHADNPSTYTIESNDITLQIPSWKGHIFTGWTWDGHDTKELIVTIDKGTTGNKTYQANWELSQYTVKFDSQGGSTVTDAPARHGLPIPAPKSPEKEGYTFKGWYTTSAYETEWNFDDNVMSDMILYAKWEINHYEVVFETNSGSAVDKQIVDHGEKAAIPGEPNREHYEFAGWYSDENLTKEFDFDTTIEAATTIYAKWTPVLYSIDYDYNGGSVSLDKLNPVFYTVETETFVLNNPDRDGYDFKGWTTKDDSKAETVVTINKGSSGNLKYKAVWEKKTYRVSFDSQGGSVVTDAAVRYEEKITKPAVPTRAGYAFVGWYKDASCENVWDFDTDVVTDPLTLYAKWMLVNYDITYELDGGSNHKENPSVYTVEDEVTLKAPTKENYEFLGWTYKGEDTPQKIVTIAKGTHAAVSYTAHLKLNEYTVNFHTNSKDVITSITVEHGGKATRPKDDPAKEGYVFNGWYADKACTKAWDFDKDIITAKTTLYAGYMKILEDVESDTESGINVNKGDMIKLSTSKGADIYYTMDGTEPSKKSQKYKEGIIIQKTTTIKAIAVKDGYADSHVATFMYHVKGNVSINTGNASIRIVNEEDELIEAILSEEEYVQYLHGMDVKVRILCEEVDKQEGIDILKLLDERTATHYYDIVVYKTLGEKDEETVEILRHPIRIVMDVPKELYPEDGVIREFKVLRIHEGRNALLDDLDDKDETVTFESDAFSRYILCYKDIHKPATDTPAIAPENNKPQVEGDASNIKTNEPEKQGGKDNDTTKKNEAEKKSSDTEKEAEDNNMILFVFLPILAGVILCILLWRKIRKKKQ